MARINIFNLPSLEDSTESTHCEHSSNSDTNFDNQLSIDEFEDNINTISTRLEDSITDAHSLEYVKDALSNLEDKGLTESDLNKVIENSNEALINIFKRNGIELLYPVSVSNETLQTNNTYSLNMSVEALSLGLKQLWDSILYSSSEMFKNYLKTIDSYEKDLQNRLETIDELEDKLKGISKIAKPNFNEIDKSAIEPISLGLFLDSKSAITEDDLNKKLFPLINVILNQPEITETVFNYSKDLFDLITESENLDNDTAKGAILNVLVLIDTDIRNINNKFTLEIGDKDTIFKTFIKVEDKESNIVFNINTEYSDKDKPSSLEVAEIKDIFKLLQFNKKLLQLVRQCLLNKDDIQNFNSNINNITNKLYKDNAGLFKQGMNVLKHAAIGATLGAGLGYGFNKLIAGKTSTSSDTINPFVKPKFAYEKNKDTYEGYSDDEILEDIKQSEILKSQSSSNSVSDLIKSINDQYELDIKRLDIEKQAEYKKLERDINASYEVEFNNINKKLLKELNAKVSEFDKKRESARQHLENVKNKKINEKTLKTLQENYEKLYSDKAKENLTIEIENAIKEIRKKFFENKDKFYSVGNEKELKDGIEKEFNDKREKLNKDKNEALEKIYKKENVKVDIEVIETLYREAKSKRDKANSERERIYNESVERSEKEYNTTNKTVEPKTTNHTLTGAVLGGIIGAGSGLFSKSGDTESLRNIREVLSAFIQINKYVVLDIPLALLNASNSINLYCIESLEQYK